MAIHMGEEVAKARKRQGYTQEQLTLDLPIDRTTLAKYETGASKLPDDLKPMIAQEIDDAEFYFTAWQDCTGEVSLPYLNGDYVDQHPSSMMFMVQNEIEEALDHLDSMPWSKPVNMINETEKEEIKRALFETLDAATSMVNLVAVICRDYRFSMKKIFREWRLTVKARRLAK